MNYYFVHGYIHRPHTNDAFSGVWEREETPRQAYLEIVQWVAIEAGVQTVAIECDIFQGVE